MKTILSSHSFVHRHSLSKLLLAALAAAVLVSTPPDAAGAPVGRAVSEVIDAVARASGRGVGRGSAEALEAAFRAHGDRVLDAARRGGLEFIEAGARHGDEFWAMAARVPDAAPHLARNADSLIPLARRHGDEVLRLEARLPGMAESAARAFPSAAELRRLNALPGDEAMRVVAYSSHAKSRLAARMTLRGAEKQGGNFLNRMDNSKILTSGLSLSAVILALGTAVAANRAPGELFAAIADVLGPVGIGVAIIVVLLGLILAWKFARWLGLLGRKKAEPTAESPVSTQPAQTAVEVAATEVGPVGPTRSS